MLAKGERGRVSERASKREREIEREGERERGRRAGDAGDGESCSGVLLTYRVQEITSWTHTQAYAGGEGAVLLAG